MDGLTEQEKERLIEVIKRHDEVDRKLGFCEKLAGVCAYMKFYYWDYYFNPHYYEIKKLSWNYLKAYRLFYAEYQKNLQKKSH